MSTTTARIPLALAPLMLLVLTGSPAVGYIYYVHSGGSPGNNGSSWDVALPSLKTALSVAGPGDEIWVAAGTYKPDGTGDRSRAFRLKNGVGVYGGFPPEGDPGWANRDPDVYVTTLSGDIGDIGDDSDNSYRVFYHPPTLGLDATAVLDGFTITRGNNDTLFGGGAGMVNDGCSPTISNCVFSNNIAKFGGGMFNYQCSPFIINCVFDGNEADDRGGGVYNGRGGIYQPACSPTLTNCVLARNIAAEGGGMCNVRDTSPIIVNCTIALNYATGSGGGIFLESAPSSTVTNSIVASNSADDPPVNDQIAGDNRGTVITYSAVQDGAGEPWFGVGCIEHYPQFADADLRLEPLSPCIDAGNSTQVPQDRADLDEDGNLTERTPLDLDGFPRFVDNPPVGGTGVDEPPLYVDMGAYEYQPPPIDIGLRVYDGSKIVTIACHPLGTLNSPLRIEKSGTIYCVVLVDPGNAAASGIVIQTASGPKALARLLP